ncbi:MAG: MBOAT family O-acyltransferase [Pyrinomonadaceae bacterium]
MMVQNFSYLLFVLLIWLIALLVRAPKGKQALLLIASYLFYATWGHGFLIILILSSVMNYMLGEMLRRKPTTGRLWFGISLNVLLLALFKYLPPLAGSVGTQASGLGFILHHILMPVGISFWTFQALSYLFDIYREEELNPTLVEFCLYLAFWPTVLAGPVCRLPEMLPQFRKMTNPSWGDVENGVRRIVFGLFMKLVLAQILLAGLNPGEGVADGFDQISQGWGGIDVWLLAIGFGFQLFFDFAGYSHIVIGTARLFGLRLEENFDRPYLSTTPSAFWTRWHMSLSFWIRDYVFMSLATVKREYWWRLFALVLSMTLFGLWHGAALTFILWGLYHGLLLAAHRLWQQQRRRFNISLLPAIETFISWGLTFTCISLGWIFFRAHDLHQALTMFSTIFSPGSYRRMALRPNFYLVTMTVIASYFIYCGVEALFKYLETRTWLNRLIWLISPVRYTAILLLIIIWSKQEAVFVYFQY